MENEGDNPAKVVVPNAPNFALRRLGRDLTARRAVWMIAAVTVIIALGGGILMRLLDKEDFSSIGEALWWSLQTVTTVGYGDVVPHNAEGRVVAGFVMLAGIGFIAVITAAVTASLIESARSPGRRSDAATANEHLERIEARLAAIEARLSRD
jgi:voltage-gated potassium channel